MPVTARVHHLGADSVGTKLEGGPCAVVIGNFDGVHRGHQAVIRETLAHAERLDVRPALLTFDPHPASVIAGKGPKVLTSLERRIELVSDLGVETVYVCAFNAAFAATQADAFARGLLGTALAAKAVIVGANFRFGRGRSGDLEMLRRIGSECGFGVQVHHIAEDSVGAYSSTRARSAIAAGDVEGARAVLGRPHELSGVVEGGLKLGRTLGFPTANLGGIAEMLPPNGVYAVRVYDLSSNEARLLAPGVMNIGVRPTLGGGLGLTVEAHLLDTELDLYGRRLRVTLEHRLRDERRFADRSALAAQIRADADDARRRFASST